MLMPAPMTNINSKTIDELEFYTGPHAIPGIRYRSAGQQLGVRAWGMNVLDIETGCTGYPEHDHVKDGQEEVYVILRGSGTLKMGDESLPLFEGQMVRVPPDVVRKILPGPQGIRFLALGGTPAKAFEPRF